MENSRKLRRRKRLALRRSADYLTLCSSGKTKDMPDALKLLTTRRSFKPVELTGPAPSPAEIDRF